MKAVTDKRAVQFVVFMVLYNHELADCCASNRLIQINEAMPLQIMIADNSTIPNSNRQFCQQNQWTYVDMGGNMGLSKAYNQLLNRIDDLNENTWIVWLDDDSQVDQNYFQLLQSQIESRPEIKIFAPRIVGQNGVYYSPNEYGFLKNHYVAQEKDPDPARFNAINNCLAVRADIYKNYRYDETLFMDSVDTKFFMDMRQTQQPAAMLPLTLQHTFFQREKTISPAQAWTRYQIRIHDYMAFMAPRPFGRWLGLIKVAAWAAEIGLKTKSVGLPARMMKLGLAYTLAIKSCTEPYAAGSKD